MSASGEVLFLEDLPPVCLSFEPVPVARSRARRTYEAIGPADGPLPAQPAQPELPWESDAGLFWRARQAGWEVPAEHCDPESACLIGEWQSCARRWLRRPDTGR